MGFGLVFFPLNFSLSSLIISPCTGRAPPRPRRGAVGSGRAAGAGGERGGHRAGRGREAGAGLRGEKPPRSGEGELPCLCRSKGMSVWVFST